MKPRNWARIDCANSHNTRSHAKKLQRMAEIFAARWNLSAGYYGSNLQFLRQRTCRKFLRSRSQVELFERVAFPYCAEFACFHGSSLLFSGDRILQTHRHILIFPLSPHSNILESGKLGRTVFRNRLEESTILLEADGWHSTTAATQLLISAEIIHHQGTHFREEDRRSR